MPTTPLKAPSPAQRLRRPLSTSNGHASATGAPVVRVLLDRLELDGILVRKLNVAEGVLLDVGAGGRAFDTLVAHGGRYECGE
ncbi:hypothetical protein NUW54_g1288 [Trametes sanguinea]|uniref:Uncharacterized protein n=1 Tax=Trametes sanguinea TaxID=158606 RepID=A0ACC1Q7C4_9APHY|nr:hypothetical protein NUW54_g1288 [Trametes sanguinea]